MGSHPKPEQRAKARRLRRKQGMPVKQIVARLGVSAKTLPYGVCTVLVHNTHLIQHIYGAIQEYGGFDEPQWLDGPPRKPKPCP